MLTNKGKYGLKAMVHLAGLGVEVSKQVAVQLVKVVRGFDD